MLHGNHMFCTATATRTAAYPAPKRHLLTHTSDKTYLFASFSPQLCLAFHHLAYVNADLCLLFSRLFSASNSISFHTIDFYLLVNCLRQKSQSMAIPLVRNTCLILLTSALSNLTSLITSCNAVGATPFRLGDKSDDLFFPLTISSGL